MARFANVEERVESPSERRVRIFLAVMFFIQTIVTSIPFIQGPVVVDGEKTYVTLTMLTFLINPGHYGDIGGVPLAVVSGILIIFPIVTFFFCVLDTKSIVKFILSGACAVVSAAIICFVFASYISIGAVITLVLNVICLFMTSQGIQATVFRKRQQQSP